MDVHLRELAARQADVVAGWQLLTAGWTPRMVDGQRVRHGWRVIHRGVYALTQAPLTRRQLWMAATLTSPGSVLSHASAGACFRFRPFEGSFETITRPGSGGPRRMGGVLVLRSETLDGDTTRHDGIPITTAARALLDLGTHLNRKAMRKAFREALRLKATTIDNVKATLARHPHRAGTTFLGALVTRYVQLPYERTRSDAESRALEILHDANIDPPKVNIKVAREEADLVWPDRKLIIEIDGPQYHQFPDEDARKQRIWEGAGFTVRRIPSERVFDEPGRLIALARDP
jgi:very-short-patch-repair endonuclease